MLGSFLFESTRLRAPGVGQCVVFAALAAPLGAQDSVVVVPDAPVCAACSLDISAMVELGDREGPGIIGGPNMVGETARVARSHDGDYYVAAALGDGRLLRFSPDGVFQDGIGRAGEGPGEYVLPVLLAGSADDLTILDVVPFRLTNIRGGEVTTTSLPVRGHTWAVLADGRHIYSGLSHERKGAGQPLHLYDVASGRVTRSFGGEGVRVDPGPRRGRARLSVAAAADGNIWVARENRYRIDKWSPDGDHIKRIERDAPWFRPWEDWPGSDYEVRPLPVIMGVGDWGNDLLMVVVKLADADWRPIQPTRILQGHEMLFPEEEEKIYDTVIEVLDIRSGTVLARTRVDAKVRGLVGQDGFHSFAEHSELGEPKIVVWSVALSGYSR